MVPPTRSRNRSKPTLNPPQPVDSCQAKTQANPTVRQSLRKTVNRVADAAGEIRQDATPPAVATTAAPHLLSRNFLDEKTITVKEAAYRLGKSTDAVYQWLRTGRLRGRQPGGRCCAILVLESSVNDALLFSFERACAGRSRRGPLAL